jgi:hypothetical protein
MSKTEKPNEEQVFKQEVADDELEGIAGGGCEDGAWHDNYYNCPKIDTRNIYKGGFPNCAATVEKGSWCGYNDACEWQAVVYEGMKKGCGRAWE